MVISESSCTLLDYDLIECLDLTGLQSKDLLDLLDITGSHGRGGSGKDDSLPSVEELLSGAGGAQGSQQTGSRRGGDKSGNTDSSSGVSTSDGSYLLL